MGDSRIKRLAQQLLTQTREGGLQWERSRYRSSYRIVFPDGWIDIAQVVPGIYSVTLFDCDGEDVGRLSSEGSVELGSRLGEIFELAEAQCQERFLDKAFSFLENREATP